MEYEHHETRIAQAPRRLDGGPTKLKAAVQQPLRFKPMVNPSAAPARCPQPKTAADNALGAWVAA